MPQPRILFINAGEPDYGQDMLLAGLVELLGWGNVLAWPFNAAYHLPRKHYPRNLGLVPGGLLANLLRKPIAFEPDLIVLGSCKPATFTHYLQIAHKLPAQTPVVFVDGGDWPAIGGDLERLGGPEALALLAQAQHIKPFAFVLKREKLLARAYGPDVLGLPFGVQADRLPGGLPMPRRYQVTFWAVESDPIRTKALALLQDRYDCRANGTTLGQTFRSYKRKGNAYLAELAASALALNLRGAGHDTLRYWEAPALQTCMVSTRPPIEIPDNFDDSQVAFIADDLSDLLPTLDDLLANPARREAMALAARTHALAHHTHRHRAARLLGLFGFGVGV